MKRTLPYGRCAAGCVGAARYAELLRLTCVQTYRELTGTKDHTWRSHYVTQFILDLMALVEKIEKAREAASCKGESILELNKLIKTIDEHIAAIAGAVYDKYYGHPDQPYVSTAQAAFKITAEYV